MRTLSHFDQKKFEELVLSAYKSLDRPDFGFAEKAYASRPYDPIIKRLRDYAAVEELAAADDDVCFGFFLKGRDALWKLDLSTVAPLGLFTRLRGRMTPDDLLHPQKADLIAFEVKVMDLLQGGGIKLLSFDELSIPVPLTLYNTAKSNVRLYQALFSDRELAIALPQSVP